MHLLYTVKQHLRATGTSATRFGKEAVGDPRLVHDLERGRECRPATAAQVLAYIARRNERREEQAHRALARALIARGGGGRIVARTYRTWWSATFWGVHHELTIEGDEGTIARIVHGLADHEFALAGHIVVDIVVVERTSGRIAMEALTIEDQ